MTKKQTMIIDFFRNKKILILGCQHEGLSTYLFLRTLFPKKKFFLADKKIVTQINQTFQNIIQQDRNIGFNFGINYLDDVLSFDLIIKTPGISIKIVELQKAVKNKTVITSNTQIFFDFFAGKIIGITGTKGKSTTTSLIFHLLKDNQLPAILIGNIGIPPLSQIKKTNKKTIAVIELSCHQLNDLKSSPHIAVVQNITSEHLDYYLNTDEYIKAKSQIARFQKQKDFYIYNDNYVNPTKLAKLSKANKIIYNFDYKTDSTCFIKNNDIYYKNNYQKEKIIEQKHLKLKGRHNLNNVMASIIVAKLFNLTNKQIEQSLSNFNPLPHRLEFVTKIKGVSYYNDSLATMPDATIAALKFFYKKNIILIAGGHERHQNFIPLAKQILKQNVKVLLLFQPTGQRLCENLKQINPKHKIKLFFPLSMKKTIQIANQQANIGDIVLLSPASASFGIFKNYQDRGNQFKQIIFKLLLK